MDSTQHNNKDDIHVEVVYPLLQEQTVIEVQLPSGSTVRDALRKSGLLDRKFADDALNIVQDVTPVGIYSERVTYDDILEEGDRVEVYRPLVLDPMEARRLRAKQQQN